MLNEHASELHVTALIASDDHLFYAQQSAWTDINIVERCALCRRLGDVTISGQLLLRPGKTIVGWQNGNWGHKWNCWENAGIWWRLGEVWLLADKPQSTRMCIYVRHCDWVVSVLVFGSAGRRFKSRTSPVSPHFGVENVQDFPLVNDETLLQSCHDEQLPAAKLLV